MRKREILDLRWDQVNLKEGTVRLAARDTKGKHPRVIILTGRVREALGQLPRSLSGYVFVNPETGKPWNQIKKVFFRARKDAGLHKLWFHDLRRSFITNARRRGVAESVVMRMSGHKTRSVFERYNVVNEDDLRDAVRVIELGSRAELDENKSEKGSVVS
jgi:integrase